LADQLDTGGANLDELWSAFSKRGLGFNASAPSSSVTAGLRETFDLPDSLLIGPNRSFVADGGVGGPFSPDCLTYALTNRSSNAVSWTVGGAEPWLNLSSPGGVLLPHSGTNVNVCISPGARTLAAGVFRSSLLFSTLTTHFVQT